MKKINQENINTELEVYFDGVKNIKCPKSMKKNLYAQTIHAKSNSWFNQRMVMTGVSMAVLATVIFKVSLQSKIEDSTLQNQKLLKAQDELNVAMHYMNRISFKSLAAVNTKGIQPAVIKPMAKSLASI